MNSLFLLVSLLLLFIFLIFFSLDRGFIARFHSKKSIRNLKKPKRARAHRIAHQRIPKAIATARNGFCIEGIQPGIKHAAVFEFFTFELSHFFFYFFRTSAWKPLLQYLAGKRSRAGELRLH